METNAANQTPAKEKANEPLPLTTGSGSSFEWITPKDRRWAEWCAWDEKILVMTHEGPCVVRVPEDGLPWYHALDDEDIADPDEWTAWSRIPRIQNTKDQPRNASVESDCSE